MRMFLAVAGGVAVLAVTHTVALGTGAAAVLVVGAAKRKLFPTKE